MEVTLNGNLHFLGFEKSREFMKIDFYKFSSSCRVEKELLAVRARGKLLKRNRNISHALLNAIQNIQGVYSGSKCRCKGTFSIANIDGTWRAQKRFPFPFHHHIAFRLFMVAWNCIFKINLFHFCINASASEMPKMLSSMHFDLNNEPDHLFSSTTKGSFVFHLVSMFSTSSLLVIMEKFTSKLSH